HQIHHQPEAPIKEKYGRNTIKKCRYFEFAIQLMLYIILGTHKEGGAVTFWSHAVSLPLSSNAILSWKFCHMVHKLLRDGHPNVDSRGHTASIRQMGTLWGNLHDRYGHIVALYAKLLCVKIDFHLKHLEIPPNLEAPEQVLDKAIAIDINKVFDMTGEVLEYMEAALKLQETGIHNVFSTSSTTPVGQCRLAPLVLVIQDCGPLYHFLVKLLFKLHSRESCCLYAAFLFLCIFFIELISAMHLCHRNTGGLSVRTQGTILETEADTLRKELEVVKPELELIKVEAQRAVVQLKSQVNILESELEDQRTHKQMALVENERLRMEVENLRAQTAVAASIQATAEDAEMVKQLSSTQQAQEELLTYKQQLAVEVEQPKQDKNSKVTLHTFMFMIPVILEIFNLTLPLYYILKCFSDLCVCVQAGDELSSVLVGLQAEKEKLLRTVKDQEAEITSLRQAAHLHQTILQQERDQHQREMTALQNQLQEKVRKTRDCGQKLQDEQFSLLQCAVVEAEGIVLDAVAKVDDPLHVRCISTPDYLINRAELTLASIDKMQKSHVAYLRNMDDASGLLRSVTQFSHLIADTIVNGAGTAHSAPTDQADRLTDNCRDCATHCLQYLKELKLKATLPRADPTAVRFVVQRILNQGQDLRPRGADVQKEELADMVDKEMAATSSAIEDAVLRMDEILSQARRDSSGVKLEVNQSIIGSCSDLMKAIHMLVTSATDLQRDIVESGRGAGSVKDFYAKNSCWTEGLISASKAVGWGATQMLESADKVVTDRGKYEELIVCSHEIAASTAQLVAASKVKADRGNKKLQTLQQASRHVNDMAAVVVSSTKSGQMQIENKNSMDFSSMSLIKLKTEEMDSQVKVLELEKQLENERIRLGELRKKHYKMGGIPMDSPPESAVNSFDSSLPTVFPDPPTMELPTQHIFILLSRVSKSTCML
uniref:Huntingtin interacting protein 1 related n=1 Tax=Sinocyclocheilus grahami TaxID=75366 RepID=A0A672L238_SINGR